MYKSKGVVLYLGQVQTYKKAKEKEKKKKKTWWRGCGAKGENMTKKFKWKQNYKNESHGDEKKEQLLTSCVMVKPSTICVSQETHKLRGGIQ